MAKATARAYAIQGLIKYHGLKNKAKRIPYHDSISVCMKSLPTITTVEFDRSLDHDIYRLNGKIPAHREKDRIRIVIETLKRYAHTKNLKARVESRNPPVKGKGLGYSSSGFAALGLAASRALDVSVPTRTLSQIVRLGAGSATRSLVGGFAIWYANRKGGSYAELLASEDAIPLRTVIVPISSSLKTDLAHEDAITSPFYKPRLEYLKRMLSSMKTAINRRDPVRIAALTEEDTLNLHAVTMTGREGIVLFNPLSISVIDEVRRMRLEDEIPVWFSLDTGPSVFVNTTAGDVGMVRRRLERIAGNSVLASSPGGATELLDKHLF